MGRLTEKDYCGYDIKDRQNFNGYDDDKDCQKIFSCLQKLGQLEDIEEELGIDLLTKSTLELEGGYFRRNNQTRYINWEDIKIDIHNKEIKIYESDFYGHPMRDNFVKGQLIIFPFSGKGKSWALTKEELEVKQYGKKED